MFARFRTQSRVHVMDHRGAQPLFCLGQPGATYMKIIGGAFGVERSIAHAELLAAARELADFLASEIHLLPYRYSFELCVMGRPDMKTRGSGMAGGFLIGGQPHSISGGMGECYLEEFRHRPDGSSYVVRRIDVREKKRIATDDCGDIKISRRKLPFTLPEETTKLLDFLDSTAEEQILVYTSDKQAT